MTCSVGLRKFLRKPARIAIAGYMGAGKTTCALAFDSADTLIINADVEAKTLMLRERRIQDGLREAFGDAVIGDDGTPRFDILGRLAFKSAESLLTLNRVTHPPVVERIEALLADCAKPLSILDAALIPLWAAAEPWFDLRIWVDVSFDIRLERLKVKRADLDETELVRRMRLQEDVLPVPAARRWIRLSDSDCRGYISHFCETKNVDGGGG